MKREVIATPLFRKNLQVYLDYYADMGAVRFIQRIKSAYIKMVDSISMFENIGAVRKRTVQGKAITFREYVLEVEPRDFLALYQVPSDPNQPIILVNIRIGGQNKFRWG
jgi:hypothetical protein